MRNHLRSTVAALGFGLMTAGAVAPTVAFAQPVTPPRLFNSQQTHYIRTTLTPQMCTQTAAGGNCTFKLGASVPYNTIILRVIAATSTAFNSGGGTDTIFLGTSQATPSNIVGSACSIHAAVVVSCTIGITGLNGIVNTGAGAAQTGTNGGFDLWVQWTTVAGTVATAGVSALIIEYIAPNDGACTAVPMGATAAGC